MSSERRPKPRANYFIDCPPGSNRPYLSFNINQGHGPGLDTLRAQLTRGFHLEETEGGYCLYGQNETAVIIAFRSLCTTFNWIPNRFS